MSYILFDIGGTRSRVALTHDGKNIAAKEIFDTPRDFDTGITKIAQSAIRLAGGATIEGAAGGLAGPLDKGRTMSINPPNLPEWKNKPFKEKLTEKLGTGNIHLINDAAMAGLGEALYGAGRGHDIVVYLTISTGIGGGRIVRGRIDQSAMGFEPGHQIIDKDSGLDLEQMVSGSAIERKYGKKAEDIHDTEIWGDIARTLAVGLTNTIVHWSPDIMVLGGSMTQSIDIAKLREYTARYCKIFPVLPVITQCELGDEAGLYGAMGYLNGLKQNG